jgi:ribose-phosphate pyrophosphokinase
MFGEIKVFTGNSNKPFAEKVCSYLNTSLGACEILKFSNDNIKVKILETVRGKDVYIIQPSCVPVNTGLMELLIMIDAIKHASAARVTAVCPYYPYARSDKKDEPRISITARLVADLLQTAGANRVMTMNLHAPQIQGFFRIPTDNLLAGRILCEHMLQEEGVDGVLKSHVVVAPDSGSAKLSKYYAASLKVPLAILDKRRYADDESPFIDEMIGNVEGKDVIIFDDEVASGGTLIEAANALTNKGAKSIRACCVHGVLSGKATQRIQSSVIKKLTVTDSVYISKEKRTDKLEIVSVSNLFGEAIKRTHEGREISPLYSMF